MQRLIRSRLSNLNYRAVPELKKKALNSVAAMQDTYYSTKDIFERHKVVFTIATSIASVATAWIGYSIRVLHQKKVENRLAKIETNLKTNYDMERAEINKLLNTGNMACFATAGTTFILGYVFGWRGGRWYANKKFRKEQMKLLGQMKPRRWQLLELGKIRPIGWKFKFPRRPFARSKAPVPGNAMMTSETKLKETQATNSCIPKQPES